MPTPLPSEESEPALLCAYNYIEGWKQIRHRINFRYWSLDSGAFAARQQGIVIDLQAYIEFCKEAIATDPTLKEVFALDVIGDWRATAKNTERMWAAGVEAIPCYHYADNNEEVLVSMARDYPKIAIGGMADLRRRAIDYSRQCFARIWPAKVHGFGMTSMPGLLSLPWDSVDSSSWKQGPLRYASWMAYARDGGNVLDGGKRSKISFRYGKARGLIPDLRPEIEAMMRVERAHRGRWARVWRDAFNEEPHFDIYLAGDWTTSDIQRRCFLRALGKER